ncbi:hypothetical protein BMETH_1117_0 [methanotrophic bacterial endosymbiont of Bathymodiolus sp.]|nr:hypothetical protein BMETH_1117_0 [methanotrophic bacterial endosymbiont of Bathymodiolus sp.]
MMLTNILIDFFESRFSHDFSVGTFIQNEVSFYLIKNNARFFNCNVIGQRSNVFCI